jgi:hypothetical protein
MDEIRTKNILIVSKRLLIFAGISVLATAALFALTFFFEKRLMISWLAFECGIIGGFVSIQQRLQKIDHEELALLSESWTSILVIPIYSGIFASILYVMFLAGILQGSLFPEFFIQKFSEPPTTKDVFTFLTETYPRQGSDIAKLIFWSFVAGFSERFVPQIINKVTSKANNGV